MLSFCIFEMGLWGCGICTGAIRAFLDHLNENLNLNVFGAFTYTDNIGSIRALEKNWFKEMETFMEDGRWSKYFEWSVQ